jgi:hypothetical protein
VTIAVLEMAMMQLVILSRHHTFGKTACMVTVSQVSRFSKNVNITTFAAYGSLNLGRL